MIYCDFNASAPVRPDVAEAMSCALAIGGNPSSVHQAGRRARAAVERARAQVADLAGARLNEVVFTSGGTEANTLALSGVDRDVYVSAIEHDSVLDAAPGATRLAVMRDGVLDLGALDKVLETVSQPIIVSVMFANNETGVVQPVAEIVRRAHEAGALVHCDAVQAAGRVPVNFAALDVDLMSLSAHKIGGPQGVGALIVRDGLELKPLLRGGGQERRLRAGTENVPGIVGFGVAAEGAAQDLGQADRVAAMRDGLETKLRQFAPDAVIYGVEAPRLANTSCVGMPGVSGETQVMAFDLGGIAISAGSACSSGKVTESHVLRAMGVGGPAAGEAVRISLGTSTTAADIDTITETWATLYKRTRARRETPVTSLAAKSAA